MREQEKETVLILSGTFGEGHQQVAYAIRDAMQLSNPDLEPIVMDFMAWAHPFLYPISRYVYIKSIKTFPQVYGYFYQKTYEISSYSMKINSFLSFEMKRMMSLLRIVQPSVVVCTFPFAAGIMSLIKECGLTDIPTVTIITDYTVHSYWVHSQTNQYIVGSSLVGQALHQMGIADSKISDTGIPIHPKFSQAKTRKSLYEKYGLRSAIPTLLIMGGGYGIFGDSFSIFQSLENLSQQIQLIIVCGHNEKLRIQLKERLKNSKHKILLTGYIDYVHELMAVSDLIISKPGGVTTTEALAMELPILLYKPLPGQEQDNARFLMDAGVAIKADTPTALFKSISDLLKDRELLTCMKRNVKQLTLRSSAFDAVDVIVKMMNQERSKPVTPYKVQSYGTQSSLSLTEVNEK